MLNINSTAKSVIYYNIMILALAIAGISIASVILFRESEICPSVFVGEIDVGRLNKQQALKQIQSYLEAKKEVPLVIISVGGEEWPLYAKDLDANCDVDHLVDSAYLVAREGHPLHRMREWFIVMQYGRTIPLEMQYDTDKLNAFAEKIIGKYYKPPINASLVLLNGQLSIIEHQSGCFIDKTRLIDLLTQSMQVGWGHKVEVNIENVSPEIVAQDLQSISQEWASYTTEFDQTDRNRTENISLAVKAINGTILKPNEVFSFNRIVGPRTSEKGYKNAPVFIQGKLVLDAGGGVCQVSSTLYNAALLANLEIIERSSHFRPPLYVPIGLDATVADNILDFRFKNNTNSYIAVIVQVIDNRVCARIFGNEQKERPEINIMAVDKEILDAKTMVRYDSDIPSGKRIVEQSGQVGYKVTTIRIVSQNGKEIRREVLAQDEFSPVEQIIRVGTK